MTVALFAVWKSRRVVKTKGGEILCRNVIQELTLEACGLKALASSEACTRISVTRKSAPRPNSVIRISTVCFSTQNDFCRFSGPLAKYITVEEVSSSKITK